MSLQAKITKKFLTRQIAGWGKGTIEERRANQEKMVRFAKIPKDITRHVVDVDGIQGEWLEPPNTDAGVMLYLHGGGYSMGSINTHRELIARLARQTHTKALAINYRLAPEHPYPAALEDAQRAYNWLLAKGFDPAKIILAGDSAGGGLALALLLALRDEGEVLPAGAVCLSPWTDVAGTGGSMTSKAAVEMVLTLDGIEQFADSYAGKNDRTLPYISPLYADLTGLPPLLIQVGTEEILLDDATRLAEKAQAVGVPVTLEVCPEMFHVFQMVPFMPETRRSLEHIGVFVESVL